MGEMAYRIQKISECFSNKRNGESIGDKSSVIVETLVAKIGEHATNHCRTFPVVQRFFPLTLLCSSYFVGGKTNFINKSIYCISIFRAALQFCCFYFSLFLPIILFQKMHSRGRSSTTISIFRLRFNARHNALCHCCALTRSHVVI